MSTYFTEVGDPSAIQVINQAQAAYTEQYIRTNLPQYAKLPVLSTASAFKTGFGGGVDYTDVAAGPLAINHAADLYLYPNTLQAVKVTGADIRTWLETAAKRFNRIDPAKTSPQELVGSFPGYNFDMFTSPEISYEIDITQPQGNRIKNLKFRDGPMVPTDEFIVATNNYRASGGGDFPGLDGSKTIFQSPDANRDIVVDYIRTAKTITRSRNGAARSWRFARATTAGPVVFHSAPGKIALARAAGIDNVSELRADDGRGKGAALYQLDLSK